MCKSHNKKTIHPLFRRDDNASKLWEAAFPDPQRFHSVFADTLAQIHELARQEKDKKAAKHVSD
jgi:hypothetical protein